MFENNIQSQFLSDPNLIDRVNLAQRLLNISVITLVTLLLFTFIEKRITVFIRKSKLPLQDIKEKRVKTVSNIILRVGYIIIIGSAITVTLSELGINIGPIVASAGVIGIAVGFGAQTVIKDLITGFLFLSSGQFNEGDVVRINGIEGMVESIGLRTVVLRDLSGISHIIPNSSITGVSNLTREWSRVNLDIVIASTNEIDNVLGVLQKMADEVINDPKFKERILERPEILGLESIEAGNKMTIKILVKTHPMKQWGTKRELLHRIKKAFEKEKITFA